MEVAAVFKSRQRAAQFVMDVAAVFKSTQRAAQFVMEVAVASRVSNALRI